MIIVSDRKNIDKQLTYTLRNLENIKGIVGDTFEQNSFIVDTINSIESN